MKKGVSSKDRKDNERLVCQTGAGCERLQKET